MERRPTGARTLGWITDRINAGANRLNRISDRIDARRAKTRADTGDGHCLDGSPIGHPGCKICGGTGLVTFHDLAGSPTWRGLCPGCTADD